MWLLLLASKSLARRLSTASHLTLQHNEVLHFLLIFAFVSYSLADSSLKDYLSQTGEQISKSADDAYGKAKKAATDAASSAKDSFNKGIDKISESIQPKDTLDKFKKMIPGLNRG